MKITKEEVLRLEHKLIEAIKGSDVAFLDKTLHEDLLFIIPNGDMITKEMDLASHRAGEMVIEELQPEFEQIKIIDDTAIVVVVYVTKGSMLGNAIEGKFRYIRFWKICNDNIKVIGGSCSILA
jgi:hypothetical protein